MRVQSIGDYYTLQGAAEELGVSYWQVWRVVLYHQAPVLQLGQTLLVLLDDVAAAIPARPCDRQGRAAPSPVAVSAVADYRVRGLVCPQCASQALVFEEGCQKCYACGYAVC